jgi:hypothetical protein
MVYQLLNEIRSEGVFFLNNKKSEGVFWIEVVLLLHNGINSFLPTRDLFIFYSFLVVKLNFGVIITWHRLWK